MNGRHVFLLLLALTVVLGSTSAWAQSPGVLYTWDGPASVDDWLKNFGTNTVVLDNNIAGQLRISEIGGVGANVAISDGANRRFEGSTISGGLDLTGLDFLEFDMGHNGSGPINVQFFIQGSTGYTYVGLGPDLSVAPGISTYQLPLAGLTPAQIVYIRTVGFSARDHFDVGDVTWTIQEVRSAGTPLTNRFLVTHDVGTSDNGLQGVTANFTQAAIIGNDGGANQTGFSHNAGLGALEWVDQGTQGVGLLSGAAIRYGNGTVYNGNTFNERLTDLSNYDYVSYRIMATDPLAGGGVLNIQSYMQTGSGFLYQPAGPDLGLPIDGQWHVLTFPLASITDRQNVQFSGLDLREHLNNLTINIDYVLYSVPEPTAVLLLVSAAVLLIGFRRHA